ncbi:hypothetical protein [Rhizobium sp. MHM7A]|uniref:hypothetical protein n=1 Tax=Rhizobium sp. MHM7A TaxID=2583233 RepID=UPI0014873D16|nr:hypothetical protein [Rhizobium sp. MHM7A]
MRNIIEYPITIEDKIAALETALELILKEEAVGGVEALALSEILSDLKNSAAETQAQIG